MKLRPSYLSFALSILCSSISTTVQADSSSPLLAAYYDKYMAICGNKVLSWNGKNKPEQISINAKQVGVGKNNYYLLTDKNTLMAWDNRSVNAKVIMTDVRSFYAGRSGVFIIKEDNSLRYSDTKSIMGFGETVSEKNVWVADNVKTAAIGDSANYYVTLNGDLFVKGLAHRGQYGDGKLTETSEYIKTADNVAQVISHTGHTLIRKQDGSVWGTGGNIYGPLGKHGYGDKAVRWGKIFASTASIATGSSHSLAIKNDGSLWMWGRGTGLTPRKMMEKVTAVAAGSQDSIALSDGRIWQWERGKNPEPKISCTD
ncbi:hypothetical protein [Aliamphritea hakodatensis]|uniref:hypothetical protein n=1 Tax=Aliamphritea hakodatensis TaxID=2895352 RepID=UPI0022FD5AC8|nr:hypothetical protein [Aliamphritea hakodatensis]